jgi:hypothetical protein
MNVDEATNGDPSAGCSGRPLSEIYEAKIRKAVGLRDEETA